MLRTKISIQAVRQSIANGVDMASMAGRGFQDNHFIPAPHEFITTAQACNTCTGNDDLLISLW
jgi:hypothetical protein